MINITINHDNADLGFLYNNDEWKNYICDDFDEKVVCLRNREYSSIEEASWWINAKQIIEDLDCGYCLDDFISEYIGEYSEEQLEKIYKEYQKCSYSDDTDFIMLVCQIINPSLELETAIAKGYVQSEWIEIVYIKDSINVSTFEAYFFGQLTEIHIQSDDGDNYFDYIRDDEVYDIFNGDTISILRSKYDLDANEEINLIKNQ